MSDLFASPIFAPDAAKDSFPPLASLERSSASVIA